MLVDFEKLPNYAKVWIYQSSRKFYPQEMEQIIQKTEGFLTSWNNNGDEIIASYQIKYNRFIILAIDETLDKISINAIDDSVSFILGLQQEFDVELLDKLNVCFKQGEFVQYKDLKEFQKLLKKKSISNKTIVFNNLINTKEELENNWEIPITESWHNRFLK
ncbi:ABC transporter ATPase [Urechidicola croceus]|uniref:ABC transporter ATPase n=1 Tax=Urechidicola croceus TaxID=1850246 RepID=A0A1D8PA71_9FLAO|nr:ABC transporter ATPase [Urechidicola croceus]AOW21431.1 ABC transporter ATPase [Urechidicola croceus]